MFDKMVESTTSKTVWAIMLAFFASYGITAAVLGAAFLGVFIWSLFSVDVNAMLGGGDLALNALVAPVPVPEAKPEPPAPPDNKPVQKSAADDSPKNVDVRTELIDNLNSPPKEIPPVSANASNVKSIRDNVPVKIGNKNSDASSDAAAGDSRTGSTGGNGREIVQNERATAVKPDVDKGLDDLDFKPSPKPSPSPTAKPAPKGPISGGVVNGKATRLVQPSYPPAAKAARAGGLVPVQVVIDESGNVISASATGGNPLLRAAAVAAARQSKFSPTQLSGQPVKVSGVINYNFVAP